MPGQKSPSFALVDGVGALGQFRQYRLQAPPTITDFALFGLKPGEVERSTQFKKPGALLDRHR